MRLVVACALAAGCGFHPSDAPSDGRPRDVGPAEPMVDALPEDLVAWYRMDDDTVPISDATGHGHDGTCAACPVASDGVVANGLKFVDARVDVPSAPELETPEGTVAGWVAFDAAPSGYACAFGKIFNPGINGNSWQVCLYNTQYWQVFVTTMSGTPVFTTDAQIVLGQWQHVALTWTTSKIELFVDGVSRKELATAPLVFDGNIVVIGADRNAPDAINVQMAGKLDDLRLYRRALEPAEIAALATR